MSQVHGLTLGEKNSYSEMMIMRIMNPLNYVS